MKHHYIPEFYLKRFTGNDGRLMEFRVTSQSTRYRHTFPGGTGYKIDLYRIDSLPPNLMHSFESQFLSLVDSKANQCLERVQRGELSWSTELRSSWIRFLLSLHFRNPESVSIIKDAISKLWRLHIDNLDKFIEHHHLMSPDEISNFKEETMKKIEKPGYIMIQNMIDNSTLGNVITKMKWDHVSLGESRYDLLVSDRPLHIPNGLSSPNGFIILPTSPRTFFLAAHRQYLASDLTREDPEKIIKAINLWTVQRARKFVWGRDSRQRLFIEKHIRSADEKPVVSPEMINKSFEYSLTMTPPMRISPFDESNN